MVNKLPEDFTLHRYGIDVRLVNEDDAEFIIKLRNDDRNSKFLSKTTTNIYEQINWIKEYKIREKEGKDYYFLFSFNQMPVGLYRIYNIENDSFVCGSWAFKPDSQSGLGILGCIIGREVAYEDLKLEKCFTDVLVDNISSISFQKAFYPKTLKTENGKIYFEHYKENFYKYKDKFIQICLKLNNNGSN